RRPHAIRPGRRDTRSRRRGRGARAPGRSPPRIRNARSRLVRGTDRSPDRGRLTAPAPLGHMWRMGQFRVGVDIGGTFTDIVLLDAGGRIHTRKVSSSVDDYARAIVDGLGEVFRETGLGGHDLAEVVHGT